HRRPLLDAKTNRVGLFLIPLLALSGCAAFTVATAGTLVGIAASSISTGADIYQLGKLDAVEMDTFDDCIAAVRLAASDLGMKIVEDGRNEREPDRRSFELTDD